MMRGPQPGAGPGRFAGQGGWNRGQQPGGDRGWNGGDRRGRDGRGWGPAAAIGAGVGLGLAAGYPYGGYYDNYSYPVERGYPVSGYSGDLGNYCETPRKTCQLYEPAALGANCSCRVPGGRAYGEVTP